MGGGLHRLLTHLNLHVCRQLAAGERVETVLILNFKLILNENCSIFTLLRSLYFSSLIFLIFAYFDYNTLLLFQPLGYYFS